MSKAPLIDQTNPAAMNTARQAFKSLNKFMIALFRLGLGGFVNISPEYGGRILVLTHTGRKSGRRLQTPVNYTIIDEDIYVTAGFGRRSDWFRNLIANPQTEVWLPDGWWQGVAEDVSDAPQRMMWLRQVLIASGFAAQMVGIDPHNMSDAELAKATADYPLVRIRRTAARTGPGGPGDLAWVWPLGFFLLLPLALRRRR